MEGKSKIIKPKEVIHPRGVRMGNAFKVVGGSGGPVLHWEDGETSHKG